MAVAFDAKATTDSAIGSASGSQTVSNMTPTAAATALVAFVAIATSGISTTLATISGVTWNGVSMTLLASKLQSNGLAAVYAFGLASPATGNHNLIVSFTGGTPADNGGYIDAVSFSGTALTTAVAFPSGNVLTDASTPSGTAYPTTAFSVTTASGDAACAVMECQVNSFGTTTGTLIRNDTAQDGNYTSAYRLAVGASTSLQFTGGASGSPAAGIAFRIQQPQGAATVWVPNVDPKHDVAISTHAKIVSVALAAGYAFVPFNTSQVNTKVAGWYQPLSTPPPIAQAQPGSSFVPFNTPQITTGSPQGWESIVSTAPAVAVVNVPSLTIIVPPFAVPSGWQSTSALAPPVAAPQFGYSFVPFNTLQNNTATIDKWQQPLSIPVLAPPVQPGSSSVPFNTAQINTAPLGWYQALASTPSAPPALQGAVSLSYNVAPVINTISGMGWFQALAATPASAPAQIGAAFVPYNTPQTVTAVSPYGWFQPLSLAPAVATAAYTQPIWTAAPFPTFTLAWQQPLASTPPPAVAQSGSVSLSYNIAPLLNTVVGMPWQQPLATAVPVAVAYQGQSFVPYNTAQIIVVTTIQHSNPFMATVGAMTCIN